ncbi:MAG TPA: DUF2092 domain-containing protein, partial [Candidatus Methylomirabilis sp.]|nr:DUF2092 domain-containing protein [Candidatus Methylomirabilis sp.]
MKHKTIVTGLSLAITLLPLESASAYSRSNRYGGSTSHSYDSTSHSSAYGTSTSHTYGEGTSHTNEYGGSTSHNYEGGTTHTNAYGGTTSGEAGYGATHTYDNGATAYHPPDSYYGYHPPTTAYAYGYHPPAPYYPGCYDCGSTAGAAAVGAAVGVATGAAIASAALTLQLEPKALEILKATSDKLAAAHTLSFTAVELFEHLTRQGAPLGYTAKYEVTLQRPDKLRVLKPADGPA